MKSLRVLLSIALVWSLLSGASAAPSLSVDGALRRGWVELVGPLEGPLFFDIGSREVLRVDVPLRSGETRRFTLVLPLNSGLEPIALGGEVGTAVRFGGFEESRGMVPPGLRARAARPPLGAVAGGPNAASSPKLLSWVGLAGALVLGWILVQRGRAWVAALLGISLALALSLVGGEQRPEPPKIHVEDGGTGDSFRIAVDSGFERLAFPSAAPEGYRLDVLPVSAPALWTLQESAGGEARLEVEVPGGQIYLRSGLEEGREELSVAVNPGPDYQEVWTRDKRGAWSSHGPWKEGEALPRALEPGRAPALPTWLMTGLPQGRTVLIARELRKPGGSSGHRWLRWTGLEIE